MRVRIIGSTQAGPIGAELVVSDPDGIQMICHGAAVHVDDTQPEGAKPKRTGSRSKIRKHAEDELPRRLRDDDDQ